MDLDTTDGGLREAAGRIAAAAGGRRRLLAAGLAALAVVIGLQAVRPVAPDTVTVWTASRDLTGGTPLHPADLAKVALPAATVPAGALRAGASVVGRLLAAPVRRGEPLTDVRLLGPALLAALPDGDLVAVPVRVADGSAAAALVGAGDLVDVLAVADPAAGGPPRPRIVAADVQVLSVPARDGDGAGLVVVAASPEQAADLAQASAVTRLSLALKRR